MDTVRALRQVIMFKEIPEPVLKIVAGTAEEVSVGLRLAEQRDALATAPVARARVATCSRESGTPSIAVLRKIEASRTRYICATRFSRGPLRSIVTMFATVPVEARHASRGLGLVVARHDVGLQWSK